MNNKSNPKIYGIFADWLKENEAQLIIPLIRAPYKKGKIYYFKGIPENLLSLQIHDGGIFVWAYHEGKAVEMLRDIDAPSGYKRGNGYYCKLCTMPEYYSSIKKLYINHCFRDLLEWINTDLVRSKYLEIGIGECGSSCATLNININWKKNIMFSIKSALLFKTRIKVKKIKVQLWK